MAETCAPLVPLYTSSQYIGGFARDASAQVSFRYGLLWLVDATTLLHGHMGKRLPANQSSLGKGRAQGRRIGCSHAFLSWSLRSRRLFGDFQVENDHRHNNNFPFWNGKIVFWNSKTANRLKNDFYVLLPKRISEFGAQVGERECRYSEDDQSCSKTFLELDVTRWSPPSSLVFHVQFFWFQSFSKFEKWSVYRKYFSINYT